MPTGYTAGVVDGTTKTFKDFAKICMRAFGAAIHMRDEPLSKKYEKRTPDSYYYENLEEAKKNLADLETLPDQYFIEAEYEKIKEDIKYYAKKINEIKETKERLDNLLNEASEWKPPTKDHVEFKKFMIQQLQLTLESDGDTSYYDEKLKELYEKLESPIDIVLVKEELRESYEYDVVSRQKRLEEEIERCKSSNDWTDELLKSIE
jgi:hypothetical protein